MSIYLKNVELFHKKFKHPINNCEDDIELKVRQLRVKLIFEELKELSEALDVRETFSKLCESSIDKTCEDGDNVSKVLELDSLLDLVYVVFGSVLSLGHHKNFDEGFSEVQSSNMSKMCSTEKEVADTIKHYKEKDVESYSVKDEDGWIILRKGDDKVLKNVYYQEAKLEKFVK